MWFGLALLALLFWSGGDLFNKLGSESTDKYSHWKIVMAVGFVMGLDAARSILINQTPISAEIILRYLPAGAMYILSMILGYVGLRYIELSILSPVCNASGAIVCILCVTILGQRLEGMQLAAVILVCAGVVGLGLAEYTEDDAARLERQSRSGHKYAKSFLALLLPVLYCLIDAAGTFFDDMLLEQFEEIGISEDSANVAYELTFFAMAAAAFVYVYIIRKEKFSFKAEWPKLPGGICETAGQLAYVHALSDGDGAVVAPMIASYCVLSAVWGHLFLKERLSFKHYLAIAATVAGIVILGIYDA